MHLGKPEPLTADSAAEKNRPTALRAETMLNISDCKLDEPMTLSVRMRKDGVWKVGHRQFPCWRDAIMGAYVVMQRIPSLAASIAQGYFGDFKTGTHAPKAPWWDATDSTTIVSIRPTRYHQQYEAKVRAGHGYPLPGDEHMAPQGALGFLKN